MNFYKKYLFILFILQFLIHTISFSQEILLKDFKTAIVTGNSKKLAAFFNKDIELSINNKADVYSKAQAQLIIKDFFRQNKPIFFKIIFEGENSDYNYAICSLKSSSKNHNIYILYRKVKNKPVIHKLEVN